MKGQATKQPCGTWLINGYVHFANLLLTSASLDLTNHITLKKFLVAGDGADPNFGFGTEQYPGLHVKQDVNFLQPGDQLDLRPQLAKLPAGCAEKSSVRLPGTP